MTNRIKKILLLDVITKFLLLSTVGASFAQEPDTLYKGVPEEKIIRIRSDYYKNGNRIHFKELSKEFRQPSVAFDLNQTAQVNKRKADIFKTCAIISFVTYVSLSLNGNNNSRYIPLVPQLFFTFFSIKYRHRSHLKMDEALEQRSQ